MTTASRSFILARLGSAVAVLPLGVWVAVHLWNNLAAFGGADAWERAVTHHSHPLAEGLTFALVMAPLLLHAFWGVRRLAESRPNNLRYPSYGNLKYLLQRLSGAGVLLFIGAHLYQAWLRPRILEGHPERFEHIAQAMRHHPPTLIVYLLGTLGVSYHLANGLLTFAMSWGLAQGKGLQRLERVAIAAFVVLLAMSWGALYALFRAGT